MKLKLFALLLTLTTPAFAAVVTYSFSGTLDSAFGTYSAGTLFSGLFSYEQTQTDQQPVTNVGNYDYTSFSLTIGTDTVSDTGPGDLFVYDNSFHPVDSIYFIPYALAGTVGGITLNPNAGLQIILQDLIGTVFNDVSLPDATLTLANFSTGPSASFVEFRNSDNSLIVGGQLSQLQNVPEPSAALLLLGSGTIFLLRRARVVRQ